MERGCYPVRLWVILVAVQMLVSPLAHAQHKSAEPPPAPVTTAQVEDRCVCEARPLDRHGRGVGEYHPV